MVVVDLGIDEIVIYEVEDNKLKEVNSFFIFVGLGFRYLMFYLNGCYVYVMIEFSFEVLFLIYDESKGSFI